MQLKPIDRTDQGESRLVQALEIYKETILPEAQNPDKQILYWIDHAREAKADQFCCFSIENRGKVIGYFQYSYFDEENIIFIEYLCLKDIYRDGLRHSYAIEKIRDLLVSTHRKGFIVVFEVAKVKDSQDNWQEETKVKNYFEYLGFRSISFEYHYPILQSYDGHTSYPADLLVHMPDARLEITAMELRTILRCIYFKHYLRWDRPFLDNLKFQEREKLINELYSRQIGRIGKSRSFPTNGILRRRFALSARSIPTKIKPLLYGLFGPKLPRLIGSMLVVLVLQKVVGNDLVLIPFVLIVLIIYCIAEDTESSRKLALALAQRLTSPRSK